MFKRILTAALVAFLPMIALAGPDRLNFGQQVNAGQCNMNGNLVINVVQQVLNNADSGFGGYWADDEYRRQIQVFDLGNNTYCAVVKYQGSWTTYAGPDPAGTGTISAGITGTFEGGYTAAITGVLNASPSAKTRGNIGSIDYACDNQGNCPGYKSWLDVYFSSVAGFSYQFWGWIYHGEPNGTWVNASSGSSGDIHN